MAMDGSALAAELAMVWPRSVECLPRRRRMLSSRRVRVWASGVWDYPTNGSTRVPGSSGGWMGDDMPVVNVVDRQDTCIWWGVGQRKRCVRTT